MWFVFTTKSLDRNFFGLDVVELLIALWKAVLAVEPEYLHVSYRESSSDYSGLYLLV
jgi:hypothetical protein